MENEFAKSLERILRFVGYTWAGIGLAIIVISNVIIVAELNIQFWFIPIDPRNSILTAWLLLAPGFILIISIILKKRIS
ncbi:MAG: hypothetical protein KZQ91_12275 [Candidatus Thiodiazotropha sp. (ex Lucinoma borealis)]|nr:hypothetical protein [Candidatus Thiodiazotropha sp. (ex Lucinoma borealis)]